VVADETPAQLRARHPTGRLDDVFRELTTRSAARTAWERSKVAEPVA
jgi:hypothetical protein